MKCQDSKQKMLQAQHFSTSNMADEVQNDNFCLNVHISIHLEIIVTIPQECEYTFTFLKTFWSVDSCSKALQTSFSFNGMKVSKLLTENTKNDEV